MAYLIITIIIIYFAIALLKNIGKLLVGSIKCLFNLIFRLIKYTLLFSFYMSLAIILGPSMLLGFIFERVFTLFKIRELISGVLIILSWVLFLIWGFLKTQPEMIIFGIDFNSNLDALSFDTLKYFLPAFLFIGMVYSRNETQHSESKIEPLEIFKKKCSDFYIYFFTSFLLLTISIELGRIFQLIGWSLKITWHLALVHFCVAVILQVYAIGSEVGRKNLLEQILNTLKNCEKVNTSLYLKDLTKDSILTNDEVETIFHGIAANLVKTGILEEFELNETLWFFNKFWLQMQLNEMDCILTKNLRHTEENLNNNLINALHLPKKENEDFLNRYFNLGSYYEFSDGRYFVIYHFSDQLKTCVSCGLTEVIKDHHSGEWYCSSICKETEELCLTIKNKPIETFITDAAKNGFILIEGTTSWATNQKIFATGGQGHGFAAEQANNKIDILMGRDAKVVGGDNAKNGADRIVQGQQIQVKYYNTGARSVGSAFEGQQGMYKYLDKSGKPMQLEVPKDQYPNALKTMENKIKAGKVPGVTDPNEASRLIRQGNITYTQAQNITKFGTLESITYDISDGFITSSSAAGISFGISAFIFYINTKDEKKAFQAAAIQAGNTFGKTLTISITTQQLHRLAAIQNALKYIDVQKISSPTIIRTLEKAVNVTNVKQLNNVLRGSLVTSVALFAITTGPDIVKLVRGRISQEQFLKNLAIVSSGATGALIGQYAGGILFSSMGPIGSIFGRMAGATIGGFVASAVTNNIATKLIEEDSIKMLRFIQHQIEYLAVTFMLTEVEIDNLNANLATVINPKTLEVLFAAENHRRSMANFFLKPVVVTIIKQRPIMTYEFDNVIDACSDWVN